MTIKELKAILENFSDDYEIMIDGGENDYELEKIEKYEFTENEKNYKFIYLTAWQQPSKRVIIEYK